MRYPRSEADESATDAKTALKNLYYVVLIGESFGVISMYEVAALNAGASMDETERTIRTAKEFRNE